MGMIDATLASFERDVLEASREVPVVVDFWAPWCGPCRALGPLLEKLERESGGRWRLVKVNSDENPELSAQFNVRSIPFVVAFVDGRPVSQFVGAQPEGAIRAFLDRSCRTRASSSTARRATRWRAARRRSPRITCATRSRSIPSNDAARLDMVSILRRARRRRRRARAVRRRFRRKASRPRPTRPPRARLESAERAATLPAASELARRIEADPGDLAARLDLAEVHIAGREFGPALEQLLEIVKRDRKFGDDVGRRKMLAVFDLAAADADLVSEFRRRLSATLY